jgi:hypothetical protein
LLRYPRLQRSAEKPKKRMERLLQSAALVFRRPKFTLKNPLRKRTLRLIGNLLRLPGALLGPLMALESLG